METSHNKRFSEMAVGVEASSLLLPSTSVIAQVMVRPVRHFAKPPGVKQNKTEGECAPRPCGAKRQNKKT